MLIFLGDENTVMKIEFLELKRILLALKEKELVKRKIARGEGNISLLPTFYGEIFGMTVEKQTTV